MRSRIAILGGRFDPPHLGHWLVAQQVLESSLGIDQVWLMPSYHHPWKQAVAQVKDRISMTNLLSTDRIKPSLVEIELKGISYTINTVFALKKKYPHEFLWIIGSDGLVDFNKWERAEQLVKEVRFIAFPRNGHHVKNLPTHVQLCPTKDPITISLSSSMVRSRVAQKLSITGLVAPNVEQYIHQHHLYENI